VIHQGETSLRRKRPKGKPRRPAKSAEPASLNSRRKCRGELPKEKDKPRSKGDAPCAQRRSSREASRAKRRVPKGEALVEIYLGMSTYKCRGKTAFRAQTLHQAKLKLSGATRLPGILKQTVKTRQVKRKNRRAKRSQL